MNHPFRFGLGMAILVLAGLDGRSRIGPTGRCGRRQPTRCRPGPQPRLLDRRRLLSATTGTNGGWITPGLPFRKLAPGVMQDVIPGSQRR